jgi:hypothetical protein
MFQNLDQSNFNHGNLTAHNIIVYINDNDIPTTKKFEDEKTIYPNFKLKLQDFSQSSITHNKIRYLSEFPKKMGILRDRFSNSDYDEMDKFYKQLDNNKSDSIKNTIKDIQTFKKILHHSPIPVPFAIEFYILIVSMMMCDVKVFLPFFRKYYFDLLFDFNLTDDVLKESNNKIAKSTISYKINELINKKQSQEHNIDLPLSVLDGISFKLKILDSMTKRNKKYIETITNKCKRESDDSCKDFEIIIFNSIKNINDIITSKTSPDEIPDKLIIYVNTNLSNKSLNEYYKNPITLNFNPLNKYEKDKMNNVTMNIFKDKKAFEKLVKRFTFKNVTNIYNAEISLNDNIGIVDNNILLTIEKCFKINEKIKLNDGSIYTIVDAKWEPESWVKNIPNKIDRNNILKKKIKLYENSRDISEEKKEKINTNIISFRREIISSNKPTDNSEKTDENPEENPEENPDETLDETLVETPEEKKVKELNSRLTLKNEDEDTEFSKVKSNIEKYYNEEKIITNNYFPEYPKIVLNFNNVVKNFNILIFIKEYGRYFYDVSNDNLPLDINMLIISTPNKILLEGKSININESYYNSFDTSENNVESVITKSVKRKDKNDNVTNKKYNEGLMKIFNDITNKDNEYTIDIKKKQIIFLKTCYNYYAAYTDTKKEIDETLKDIESIMDKNNDNIKQTCKNLYYLNLLHKSRELVYNYYLYRLYNLILVDIINKHNYNATFTKQKIINSSISSSIISSSIIKIDQTKYNSIVEEKKKLYLKTYDLLYELNTFYKNNENPNIFSKNLLMDIIKKKHKINKLNELSNDISNDISKNTKNTKKEYTIFDSNYGLIANLGISINENLKPDDFLYNEYIIKLSNNLKRETFIYIQNKRTYHNETINTLNNSLNNTIKNSIQYAELKNQNYDENEKIIKAFSKIFNCMIYNYTSVKIFGKQIIPMCDYTNQKYTIILYNKTQIISYNNIYAMKYNELPELLKIHHFCIPDVSVTNGSITMIGGYNDIKDIEDKSNNLSASIEAKKNNINRLITEKEKEKNKNNDISDKLQKIKNERVNLTEKYKEYIENADKLIKLLNNSYSEQNKDDKIKKITNIRNKYQIQLNNLKNEIKREQEMNRKVYGIVVNLILYPGENPNILDKQTYKCKSSFNDLKKEYCKVFGIGCDENKKVGGTRKNKRNFMHNITMKKYNFKKI